MEIELLTMFYGLANFGVPCLKDFVKANFWHGTAKVLSSSSFLFHFSILTFEGSMDTMTHMSILDPTQTVRRRLYSNYILSKEKNSYVD